MGKKHEWRLQFDQISPPGFALSIPFRRRLWRRGSALRAFLPGQAGTRDSRASRGSENGGSTHWVCLLGLGGYRNHEYMW